ncbi:MAG: TonB-dependent receptor plug domain-containing protein, partial [Gemmataceae bacterium]
MQDRSRALAMAVASAIAAFAAAGTSSAMAADATAADPATTSGQTGTAQSAASLQEIVVTAAKFNENVLNSALSLTAINGDELQEQHINSWQDLQSVVPGLSVQTTPAGTTFNIRGIGDAFNNPNISQG